MTLLPRALWIAVFTAALALPGAALPQWRCDAEQKVKPADLAAGDIYGAAVAVDRNVAVVASEWDDENGFNSGSVYVYRRRGGRWVEEQKLVPADGAAGDNFGRSVDIEGDVVVVGAHWDDDNGNNAGSAYVYRFDGQAWQFEQKLLASDGQANDRFGLSVAVAGDQLGVSAWREDEGGADAGAAYMYRFDGNAWGDEQKLMASDAAAGDQFGRYLSLDRDLALIGAWRADVTGTDEGAAYVFRHDGSSWYEEQRLVADDGATGDEFGWATYILGDLAVVGAPRADAVGMDSGAAYVYRFAAGQWTQTQKLVASDAKALELFGYSIAIDAKRVLVAASVNLQTVAGPGSLYLYRDRSMGLVEEQKIEPSDGAPQDAFGFHASMSGRTVLTGSWRDDDAGPDSGSAYFYTCGGRRAGMPGITPSGPLTYTPRSSGLDSRGGTGPVQLTVATLEVEGGRFELVLTDESSVASWALLFADERAGRAAFGPPLAMEPLSDGRARFALRVPSSSTLAGRGMALRCVVLDRAGARWSNAVRLNELR